MTEMVEKDQTAKIRKGLPPRSPVCYQTQQDIVIPAGTILRHTGGDEFAARIGFSTPDGRGTFGDFAIETKPGEAVAGIFKKVNA